MFHFLLVTISFSIGLVSAEPGTFSFASYYGDHMVLARHPQKAVVWGYTDRAGENITGTMHTDTPATVSVMSVSEEDVTGGVWSIVFPSQNPTKEGVKIEAMKSGGQVIAISDVLFGDVWICSGQSNMQFTLDMAFNASEELQDAEKYPDIRVFTATEETSPDPLIDLKGVEEKWSLPNKDSLGHRPWTYFSAVCWLYGRNLHRSLHVPIGLISSTWGGTAIELWSSTEALRQCNITQNTESTDESSSVLRFQRQRAAIGHSELWNAMMNPFTRLTIYGVIWYQGEANAGNPDSYLCTFPTMIDDWRQKFKAANNETDIYFPFGFVQLAPWRNESITKGFPDIRWHQTADVGYVPNDRLRRVFMAVAIDLPDYTSPAGSIHPRDKQDVAERLTISSLVVAYGANFINFQGPKISSVGVEMREHKLTLNFDQSSVLIVRSKKGFEICCTVDTKETCDGINSTWVEAPITDHDSHTVTISYGGECLNKKVVGLRYAWQESPCEFKKCAMYQTENLLPMAPYQNLHFNHSSDINVYNTYNGKLFD